MQVIRLVETAQCAARREASAEGGGGRQRIEASIMGKLLRVIERCIGAWNVCNLF